MPRLDQSEKGYSLGNITLVLQEKSLKISYIPYYREINIKILDDLSQNLSSQLINVKSRIDAYRLTTVHEIEMFAS